MASAPRSSLRLRVALAFAGFGAMLSVVLTTALYLAAHDVSERLMDEALRAELQDQIARRDRNPESKPLATATLRGYVSGAAGSDVPSALAPLEPGRHDVRLDGVSYRAAVGDRAGERLYILFNREQQRERERRFVVYLAAAALAMTLFSATVGFWLARRVIAPVTELARAVRRAEPEDPPSLEAAGAQDGEVGELARAFTRYLGRLHDFIGRERAFASDASHELRTPLAVVQGAAEVLAEDAALTDPQRERVGRIRRAADEMSDLITALLLLAREAMDVPDEPTRVLAVVEHTLARLGPAAAARNVRLSLEVDARPEVRTPPALLAIAVGNLVRNAVAHSVASAVTVRVGESSIVVSDAGVGMPPEALARAFDRNYRGPASRGSGIGLALVKRICDRCGWQATLESRPGGGTRAVLALGDFTQR